MKMGVIGSGWPDRHFSDCVSAPKGRRIPGKRLFLITVFFLTIQSFCTSARAEPAPPFPVKMTQPDGTEFMAIIQGDEYYIHIETIEGYTIIKKAGNWYYAGSTADGDIISTSLSAGIDDPSTIGLAKHIERSQELINRIRNSRLKNSIEVRSQPLDQTLESFEKPLTILADFEPGPYQHIYTRSQFYDLLFSEGTYPTGSMKEYYFEVSYGNFTFSVELDDITDWTLAPRSYDYYCNGQSGMGDWPQNSQGLLVDLATVLDPDIDFSRYDNDYDGYVDAIKIIVEGGRDLTGDNFLAHAGRLYGHSIQLDGVWLDRYDLVYEQLYGEIHPIGTHCHEYAHVLGLPDLYDKDRSSAGIGYWGLMAYGSWNSQTRPAHLSAWSKALLGWVTPRIATENVEGQNIPNVEQHPEVYRLWTNGDSGHEYFLVENRQPLGFDENLLGSGLLIWHIDDNRQNNNDERHKKVDLEEADGEDDLDYHNNRGDAGDPFPGAGGSNNPNYSFDRWTFPNSNAYGGAPTQVAVTRISESGDTMTADFSVMDSEQIPTLSEWGMLILALLLLAIGTVAVVTRRKAALSRIL